MEGTLEKMMLEVAEEVKSTTWNSYQLYTSLSENPPSVIIF
jgi:hypothetical protein